MRLSATCSRRGGGRRGRAAVIGLAAAVALAAAATPAPAKVFMTQDEALRLAFPADTGVQRRTAWLTDEQAAAVEKLSGEKPASRVVTWYEGRAGTAWFDTHVVRTLPETIMIVVTPAGVIGRVDILSFGEPVEYLPRAKWLEQLGGRALDEDLSLRRGVRPITGATLSARAIVAASRRTLALRQVLAAGAPPAPSRPEARP